MRILLHICCAPCAIYPVEQLKREGFEVHGLWYNPNIHPYQEYLLRLETLKHYAARIDLPVICKDEYGLREFIREVVYRETERCLFCYRLRLKEVARIAKEGKFHSFTSTLLVSPHQKHDLIKEVSGEVGREAEVEFYYQDFRPGLKESIKLSREMGLYRQQYCGCIYSECERFKQGLDLLVSSPPGRINPTPTSSPKGR